MNRARDERRKNMTIRAWKHIAWPTFIVQVGPSLWEMSDNADQANGVCMYAGSAKGRTPESPTEIDALPMGVVRAIVRKVRIDDGAITA